MANTFFTADLHLNHAKALTFEAQRSVFTDVSAHDAHIIATINKYVRKQDVLWLLGDVFLGTDLALFHRYMQQINAEDKRFIPGNHDEFPMHEYCIAFNEVSAIKKKYGFVMSHVPIHPDCLEYRWFKNVHGHLHSNKVMRTQFDIPKINGPKGEILIEGYPVEDKRYLCVSAESHPSGEFARPWSLKEVREYFGS